MPNLTADLIELLEYLLPGFLAAWIFYGLTSHPKPSQFERVVQALIFTLIIQAIVSGIRFLAFSIGQLTVMGPWTDQANLTTSILCAVLLGLFVAYAANFDVVHGVARGLKLTRETSYPSEWFGTFLTNMTYVVLHLEDGRRIYGWPREWPSEPGSGQFALEDVSWLDDSNEIHLSGVKTILIPAQYVQWVEFIHIDDDETNGEKVFQSASAEPS